MEVVKTWVVRHKNGRTLMYQMSDNSYILAVPTPTGQCWTDILEVIKEHEASKYIYKSDEELE